MASVGAASKTFDEMIATIHLNKTTHSLEAYRNLLEDLIVSILCIGVMYISTYIHSIIEIFYYDDDQISN